MALTEAELLAAFHEAAALQTAGLGEAALGKWEALTVVAPDSGEAWHNLAGLLAEAQRYPQAEAAHRRAADLRPDKVWAQYGLAGFLHRVGRWREAEAPYARALQLEPRNARLRVDFGHLLLGLGDFARGWPLYESRMDVPDHGSDRLPNLPEWQGEPIAGRKLLIWPEQGYGDQIQFARYAAKLQAAGADVTLACPPQLAGLFASLPVKVVANTGSLTVETPDYWALTMSTPWRLGLGVEDIDGAPYLSPSAQAREKWAGFAPKGSIGVAWRGRQAHPNEKHRSLPSLDVLEPLRAAGANLIDLAEIQGDFADVAAVIEQLELVVSVDTVFGHLAGALGKPCFVMLPWLRQDWRWFQDREDSPWYRNHRLFRQSAPGDWTGVVERVAAAHG